MVSDNNYIPLRQWNIFDKKLGEKDMFILKNELSKFSVFYGDFQTLV